MYRNRFSRHTWHARGDGTQGYWTTELPDSTLQYFGVTAEGQPFDSARVSGRTGATFRYHLMAQVDKFGHRMEYGYRSYDGLPHLDREEYIFTSSDGEAIIQDASQLHPNFNLSCLAKIDKVATCAGWAEKPTVIAELEDLESVHRLDRAPCRVRCLELT